MAQKTYKQIQDEANRLFGKGASDKKFEWRRQQQEAAGLEQEKKTRGGVAGAYDRNKALVQAAVPLIAGALIPGSSMIAGALAGGAARGLDREARAGRQGRIHRGGDGQSRRGRSHGHSGDDGWRWLKADACSGCWCDNGWWAGSGCGHRDAGDGRWCGCAS